MSKIPKAFANDSPANIKFSKTKFPKIQTGGFNIFDLVNSAKLLYKIANKAKVFI